jgi:Tol biopolymer transport system component
LSPDARYLAFASNAAGQYDIYVVNQNTGELSQLTSSLDDEFPGDWWQPPS